MTKDDIATRMYSGHWPEITRMAMPEPKRLEGCEKLIDMPGPGAWRMTVFGGDIIVVSAESASFVLKMSADGPVWEKVVARKPA